MNISIYSDKKTDDLSRVFARSKCGDVRIIRVLYFFMHDIKYIYIFDINIFGLVVIQVNFSYIIFFIQN